MMASSDLVISPVSVPGKCDKLLRALLLSSDFLLCPKQFKNFLTEIYVNKNKVFGRK